jgi:hypothetical protein
MPNYTINTVGAYDSGNDRTPITINETAPGVTFAAGGRVINLTRNIELLDESAPTAQYGFNSYTERLQIDWNQQANMHRQYIKDALFLGFRQIYGYSGSNFDFENCVFHNCDQLFYYGADLYFKNTIFYSMYYVFYRTFGHLIDGGGFYAIDRIMNSSVWGMKIKDADLLNNQYCLYNYSNTIVGINLNFRNNRYIARDCHDIKLKECVVDQCDRVFYTTYNVYARGSEFKNYTYLYNFTFTGSHFAVLEDCILGTTRKPLRVYHTAAEGECLESGDTGWQSPPSGNSWILEITPKSDIDARQNFFELSPDNLMAAYAETGSKTITFKIYPSGWSTALDQDDIYLEAYYLDQASGISRALAVTGSGTFANGGWRDLTVTFNPAQAGTVYFNLILTRYEASAYVLVDPVWDMS